MFAFQNFCFSKFYLQDRKINKAKPSPEVSLPMTPEDNRCENKKFVPFQRARTLIFFGLDKILNSVPTTIRFRRDP